MDELTAKENHVYLSLDQDVYGKIRFTVSVNFPTLEESEKTLGEAVEAVIRVMAEKNLSIAERNGFRPKKGKTTSEANPDDLLGETPVRHSGRIWKPGGKRTE